MKISLKFSGKVMNSKNFHWSILHSLGGPYAAWNKNPTKSKSQGYNIYAGSREGLKV